MLRTPEHYLLTLSLVAALGCAGELSDSPDPGSGTGSRQETLGTDVPGAGATVDSSMPAAPAGEPEGGAPGQGDEDPVDDAGGSGAADGPRAGLGGDAGPGPTPLEMAPTVPVTFAGTDDDFNNPERGFYRYGEVTSTTDFERVYADGYTLVYSYVRLDDHRDAPIDQALLDAMDAGLDAARAAGLKLILRFAYNFGPYPNSEPDAPVTRILAHIEQLRPYLAAHEDVVAAVQAGFIGAWGEWHTSTNGLDNLADKQTVLDALLAATPATRTVHVRYPPDKQGLYGDPLSEASAFDGQPASRTGHHNDCFLSSDTDVGTYPSNEVEQWKTYLEQDTKFVPMGGETCATHARAACPVAMAEMRRLHYSYLNRDYHPDVIDRWSADGCYGDIKRSLGYRLALTEARVPSAVRPGGGFLLEVELENRGYAAPFNPRPVQVVLANPSGAQRATLAAVDPRRWLPGDPIRLRIAVQLPSDLAAGEYQLGLALPDASQSLADRPRYAIRFANAGVWGASTGVNALATVRIDAGAPGGVDPAAASFTATVAE